MPMLPEQIWRRRLESEFEELRDSGEKFEANADYTSYVVSIRGPGLYKNGDAFFRRDLHSVQIDLKREFPYAGGIEVVWLTPIFHPNIRPEDGKVCIKLVNEWSETTSVAGVVTALKQLLEKPNPNDALNKEAADYFAERLDGAEEKRGGPRIV